MIEQLMNSELAKV